MVKKEIVGYDFDKTIYDGDSSTDFFFYMISTRPYLLIFTLWFLIVIALYGMRILSKKKTKECLFFFVPWFKNINRIVDKFWCRNANKIKDWYSIQKRDDDIIITASLGFIVKPMADALNIKSLIATNFSTSTGKIVGKNCYGNQKVVEFQRLYPKHILTAYYSDSLSDKPVMELAGKGFLVDGNKITEVNLEEQ
ncbi:MAG: HAD-IB family phosphatase [Clostridia bacterium]|nr:HAD-IB family phosphatase [Clostridia bacterium]